MRRVLITILCAATLGCVVPAVVAEAPITWSAPEAKAPAPAKGPLKRWRADGVSGRDRRRCGVTFRNVRRVHREMSQAGELEGLDRATAAVLICNRLRQDNSKAFLTAEAAYEKTSVSQALARGMAEGERDWEHFFDVLIRFIEALMLLFG